MCARATPAKSLIGRSFACSWGELKACKFAGFWWFGIEAGGCW